MEKTKEELMAMLRRNYREDLCKMRRAAVDVVEGRGKDRIQNYKYLSGRVDAIASFARCAFHLNLFEEPEN